MKKYHNLKGAVVTAFQLTSDVLRQPSLLPSLDGFVRPVVSSNNSRVRYISEENKSHVLSACLGQWVIKQPNGALQVVEDSHFRETYKVVDSRVRPESKSTLKYYYQIKNGVVDESKRFLIGTVLESDFTGDHPNPDPNPNHFPSLRYVLDREKVYVDSTGEVAKVGDTIIFDEKLCQFFVVDYRTADIKFDDVWQECEDQEQVETIGFKPSENNHDNALNFEIALRNAIQQHLGQGLTVTEAIGTLQLCQMDIFHQFTKANNG